MIETIEKYICEQEKIDSDRLHSKSRTQNLCEARQMIMYFARLHGYSEKGAGLPFDKDHSTVHAAVIKIENLCATDKYFYNKIRKYGIELGIFDHTSIDMNHIKDVLEELEQGVSILEKRISNTKKRLEELKNKVL